MNHQSEHALKLKSEAYQILEQGRSDCLKKLDKKLKVANEHQ